MIESLCQRFEWVNGVKGNPDLEMEGCVEGRLNFLICVEDGVVRSCGLGGGGWGGW